MTNKSDGSTASYYQLPEHATELYIDAEIERLER